MIDISNTAITVTSALISALISGLTPYFIVRHFENKKIKSDVIKDLMAYRGDYSSEEFRRTLNKVSIVFHDDSEIRGDIRKLYEIMQEVNTNADKLKRSIVGLIYKLCQKNNIKKLTEYDIDQAFPENKQQPQ